MELSATTVWTYSLLEYVTNCLRSGQFFSDDVFLGYDAFNMERLRFSECWCLRASLHGVTAQQNVVFLTAVKTWNVTVLLTWP
jgi:hypothetical protein